MFDEHIELHKSLQDSAFPHEKRSLKDNFEIIHKRLKMLHDKQVRLDPLYKIRRQFTFFIITFPTLSNDITLCERCYKLNFCFTRRSWPRTCAR